MAVIDTKNLDVLADSVRNLESFYKDLRSLFEFVETRFKIPEYGSALQSINKHEFHSNASGFKLSDDSDYPYYLWIPAWLGRFYVTAPPAGTPANAPCPESSMAATISFVWVWHGSGDAYVEDQYEAECWIGVARPLSGDPGNSLDDLALTIFQQFRLERNSTETDEDGWIQGKFHANQIGCDLTGDWSIQRIPLREMQTYYQIEKRLIKPLAERHHASSMAPAGS